MKVFAINLASQLEKKTHILNECERHGLDVEIVNAVYGKELSKEELQAQVHDYPSCYLTLGEIGCALSHVSIYERMVEEKISMALVLEDDAMLDESINAVLQRIEAMDQKDTQPRVYLLSPAILYLQNFQKQLDQGHTVNKTLDAYYAYAYVLNLAAAKKLAAFLKPVRYEADRWAIFEQIGVVDIYNIVPAVANTNDVDKAASDLEEERAGIMKLRGDYFRELRKREMPVSKKFLRVLMKLFIHLPFIKTGVGEARH